ncbi:3-oxoacyl-[acyl-carrier-protein] synthase I, chloroplastic [Gossypium arboreum]|uniref:3-oxoacyl-[acyl-carrier-protein] synthase I, chloroplastic n=1 Tax=Gossypium arboreum TaxID=29729 RepID=A0A0B0N0Y8_GOSAR|nr:3-oxoacyl-[acyl-carrier-protein] synthase I, chloroplastic [Gossypium arboreum]
MAREIPSSLNSSFVIELFPYLYNLQHSLHRLVRGFIVDYEINAIKKVLKNTLDIKINATKGIVRAHQNLEPSVEFDTMANQKKQHEVNVEMKQRHKVEREANIMPKLDGRRIRKLQRLIQGL